MDTVTIRDLRNHGGESMDRVEAGEHLTVTRDGRPWAVLTRRAIPQLGLQVVVETIASHVRLRKAQRDGRRRFRHAIAEW